MSGPGDPSEPSDAPGRVRLEVPGASVVLDLTEGGRAVSWRVDDLDLLGGRGLAPVEHGMYAMAPWAGRVRGNRVRVAGRVHDLPVTHDGWALHGTVLDRPAELLGLERAGDAVRARTTAPLGDRWPWPGAVILGWELAPGMLRTSIEVVAEADAFPAVVGWHPWFPRRLARGGVLDVGLAASAMLERGDDHLPTGREVPPGPGPYDDAFRVPDGRATLTWAQALRLDVAADVSWFVVFDELADWVCVEPQTGPPDGLGDEAAVAAPDRPVRASATWSWTLLSEGPAAST